MKWIKCRGMSAERKDKVASIDGKDGANANKQRAQFKTSEPTSSDVMSRRSTSWAAVVLK